MAEEIQNGAVTQLAWDVAQYEEALAHLERLQDLIDCMRSTVPSIVAPIQKCTPDKAQLFVEIKTAAVQGVNNVQKLRDTWTSEQTQTLFKHSTDSLQKDGDLSKADEVSRYGWI